MPQRPQGQVKSPADWKGRHLGITEAGSSTDFLTQYLTKKAGVDRSMTTHRGVGAGQTFIAAMKQKAIVSGMTTEPTVSPALSGRRQRHCSTCVPRRAPMPRSAAPTPPRGSTRRPTG